MIKELRIINKNLVELNIDKKTLTANIKKICKINDIVNKIVTAEDGTIFLRTSTFPILVKNNKPKKQVGDVVIYNSLSDLVLNFDFNDRGDVKQINCKLFYFCDFTPAVYNFKIKKPRNLLTGFQIWKTKIDFYIKFGESYLITVRYDEYNDTNNLLFKKISFKELLNYLNFYKTNQYFEYSSKGKCLKIMDDY